MQELERLLERIVKRVNSHLGVFDFDVGPCVRSLLPLDELVRSQAVCGFTPHHPLHFQFSRSNLAGSYFLGECRVDCSILYHSDLRGDELKSAENHRGSDRAVIPLWDDEVIRVLNSCLINTLVHNHCHAPEYPDDFLIRNTVSMPYANIHGSPMDGCFLGTFSTVDLTAMRDCLVGTYSYVQVGRLTQQRIDPGRVWVKAEDGFEFRYDFKLEQLVEYIDFQPDSGCQGILVDFVEKFRDASENQYRRVPGDSAPVVAGGSCISDYAVVCGDCRIGNNVLVAQRAYLENATLGDGANAQENCYIIDSELTGDDVTAHGGKIIHARLGKKVFVGFNSFIRGRHDQPVTIGEGTIIMPHTIIDAQEALQISDHRLVWGLVKTQDDLRNHSMKLEKLATVQGEFRLGNMRFTGQGSCFVDAFRHRIDHILEENGACFDGACMLGHAQKSRDMAFAIIQPFRTGKLKGLYPTLDIRI